MSDGDVPKTKPYGMIGVVGTVAWALLFAGILGWKYSEVPELKLNEWGDFLSGFLAGLAILWLVLSFFQQAEELRLNTEALRAQHRELGLQREELRLQRKATTALVEQATRQAEASEAQARYAELETDALKRRAWPLFEPSGGSGKGDTYLEAKFQNHGGVVSELQVLRPDGCTARLQRDDVVKADAEFVIYLEKTSEPEYPARFDLRCRTALGEIVDTTVYYLGGTKVRCEAPQRVET